MMPPRSRVVETCLLEGCGHGYRNTYYRSLERRLTLKSRMQERTLMPRGLELWTAEVMRAHKVRMEAVNYVGPAQRG